MVSETSFWHGWIHGYKPHLDRDGRRRLAAASCQADTANAADNEQAPRLLDALTSERVFVLGDTAYYNPELQTFRPRISAR